MGWRLLPPDPWPPAQAHVKLFIAQDFISKSNVGSAFAYLSSSYRLSSAICLVAKLGEGSARAMSPAWKLATAPGQVERIWHRVLIGYGVQLLGEVLGDLTALYHYVGPEPAVPAPRSSRASALLCAGVQLSFKCLSAVRSYVFEIEAGQCPEAVSVVLSPGNGPLPWTPRQCLQSVPCD